MEFRSEKTNRGALIALLLVTAAVSPAQTVTVEVRHLHMRGGATGQLVASPQGIHFEEAKGKHTLEMKYADIQQITLTRDRLRILTDQDQPRWLGRDREIVFDHLPEGAPLIFRQFHEVRTAFRRLLFRAGGRTSMAGGREAAPRPVGNQRETRDRQRCDYL
jgi:hypothetical protein